MRSSHGDEFVISGGCALLQLDDRRQSPSVPLPATSWRFHSSSAINPTRYRPCTQSLTYSNLAWTRLVDEPYLRSAWAGSVRSPAIYSRRAAAGAAFAYPGHVPRVARLGTGPDTRHSVHDVTKSILNRRGLVHMWPPQSLTPQRCDGQHAHRWLRLAKSDLRCLGGSGGVEVGHRNGVSGCS